MEKLVTSSFRLGIIGGGQLGRMLALKAAQWDLKTHCLDKDEHAPARLICDAFQQGSMTNYDDVVSFGRSVDAVTVESDNVNADALETLEQEGKPVYPSAATLRIIQDKGEQRRFCDRNGLPVPRYEVFENKQALLGSSWKVPYIIKTRSAGYDGKGVFAVNTQADLARVPDQGLVAEEMVSISKELTVIAARNGQGEMETFPVIELFVEEGTYLVDYLICPAEVDEAVQKQAKQIARGLIEALNIRGLLAVEMFLTTEGRILINEASPRPHNSGHHTIESAFTSQYEQHLRGIFDLPMGSCEPKTLSGMVNVLGAPGASGKVRYHGLTECLKMPGVKVHIYGKQEVTPRRKMGHVTILNADYGELHKMIRVVKQKVKVEAWPNKTPS